MPAESFYEVLTAAVRDLADHGFDRAERLEHWQKRLLEAAERSLKSPAEMEQLLRDGLSQIYRKLVERGGALKFHPGVERFTLDRLAPVLRSELDRRILASAQLIKLNRQRAIEQTLQRFSGWATSIPAGGSEVVEKVETKTAVRKALAALPFEERRVLIDQGHKLAASINEVIARNNNAIATVWRSHWRQAGYHYRKDHKDRDGKVYLLRGNWAQERGLVKVGPDGYYDDITAYGQEVFCRCFGSWLTSLRQLPADLLTAKGRAELAKLNAA